MPMILDYLIPPSTSAANVLVCEKDPPGGSAPPAARIVGTAAGCHRNSQSVVEFFNVATFSPAAPNPAALVTTAILKPVTKKATSSTG
jgi:hypothetical protein